MNKEELLKYMKDKEEKLIKKEEARPAPEITTFKVKLLLFLTIHVDFLWQITRKERYQGLQGEWLELHEFEGISCDGAVVVEGGCQCACGATPAIFNEKRSVDTL